ncbi:MAG: hypothetical protein E7559_03725 [Ruminococcaceae bacterium]|nr:hypothetical protein [Oscillospiraceae bacterium]
MKIYTIIAGVNGTGKSSLTGALKAERTDLGCLIDVDKLTVQHNGDYLAAGREAVRKIDCCIERGVCFTQETTLSGSRTERTVKRAREAGYYIRLYYIGLDTAEESLRRIANRVAKGGHDIPREDVERRFSQRFESLVKVLPYCDEVTLFDNDNGFAEVAEYRNGELVPKGSYRPKWLDELAAALTASEV